MDSMEVSREGRFHRYLSPTRPENITFETDNNVKTLRVHKNPSSFTGQCYGLLRFLSHTQ